MRIAYVTAGAAGMLCGSCIHDNTLAAALQDMGHDVALIPTYTPVRTDEDDVSLGRVFYGALNVYLEQRWPLFRHTPRLVDWMLERPALLNWLSRRAISADAHDLGALTVSVLEGEEGPQSKELGRLVGWLQGSFRPEIVHITNSMFLGLAGPLKRELGVPVVCSLQGEDLFIDELIEPYRSRAQALLREHADEVDGFVATSRYYADFMTEYLDVQRDRVEVVYLGIKLDGHARPSTPNISPRPRPAEAVSDVVAPPQDPDRSGSSDRGRTGASDEHPRADDGPGRSEAGDDGPFVIGYLARLCPEKGLAELAEAYRILAARVGDERLRLRAAGYLAARDRAYVDRVRGALRADGLEETFELHVEISRDEKIDFLQGLDVLAVPTVYREPKGLFVLEALANGVPVVQPAHGSFPEMIELTGGGLLSEPGSAASLADRLGELMDDPERRSELGRRGQRAVHERFSDRAMAQATLRAYRGWLESHEGRDPARPPGRRDEDRERQRQGHPG